MSIWGTLFCCDGTSGDGGSEEGTWWDLLNDVEFIDKFNIPRLSFNNFTCLPFARTVSKCAVHTSKMLHWNGQRISEDDEIKEWCSPKHSETMIHDMDLLTCFWKWFNDPFGWHRCHIQYAWIAWHHVHMQQILIRQYEASSRRQFSPDRLKEPLHNSPGQNECPLWWHFVDKWNPYAVLRLPTLILPQKICSSWLWHVIRLLTSAFMDLSSDLPQSSHWMWHKIFVTWIRHNFYVEFHPAV